MDRVQSESMDQPITLAELQQAVAEAAHGKAPGLDGLPYEFYAAVLHLVGGSLVEALNTMLERGALTASLQRGVVTGQAPPEGARGSDSFTAAAYHITIL